MHEHVHLDWKPKKKVRKSKREKNLEDFVQEQLEKYVELHKEHEKDLDYIG